MLWRTLTCKKPVVSLSISSLKGNTVGIISDLNESDFEYVTRMTRNNVQQVEEEWVKSDIIMLGCSTYYGAKTTLPEFPEQLIAYKSILSSLSDKRIILFGSGNSDFQCFCGAVDYLSELLKEKNKIEGVYKFVGYPRKIEQQQFKEMVENIIYEY